MLYFGQYIDNKKLKQNGKLTDFSVVLGRYNLQLLAGQWDHGTSPAHFINKISVEEGEGDGAATSTRERKSRGNGSVLIEAVLYHNYRYDVHETITKSWKQK